MACILPWEKPYVQRSLGIAVRPGHLSQTSEALGEILILDILTSSVGQTKSRFLEEIKLINIKWTWEYGVLKSYTLALFQKGFKIISR